jgi:hypothetical protein
VERDHADPEIDAPGLTGGEGERRQRRQAEQQSQVPQAVARVGVPAAVVFPGWFTQNES